MGMVAACAQDTPRIGARMPGLVGTDTQYVDGRLVPVSWSIQERIRFHKTRSLRMTFFATGPSLRPIP